MSRPNQVRNDTHVLLTEIFAELRDGLRARRLGRGFGSVSAGGIEAQAEGQQLDDQATV